MAVDNVGREVERLGGFKLTTYSHCFLYTSKHTQTHTHTLLRGKTGGWHGAWTMAAGVGWPKPLSPITGRHNVRVCVCVCVRPWPRVCIVNGPKDYRVTTVQRINLFHVSTTTPQAPATQKGCCCKHTSSTKRWKE